MCSRETDPEAKPSSKRISALKIFYIIGFVSAFTFIAFIYFQDYTQNAIWQIYEPKPSDAPPTNRTFLEEASTACGVIINEGPLIKVGDLNTYVTGSYMDHRFREVKSIAIVNRQQLVTYSCVLCCNGKNVTTLARYAIHSDHFGFEYGTATIACPLNDECLKPTHVALTSSSANHSESITSFQSIMNRDVPAAFPHQFTVCISVMYDYTNVLNLVEAMEMFRLLGATRVAIYLTNCDSNVQKVLDYYVDRGFAEVIPWTIKKHVQVSSGWRKDVSGGELHYYGQIPALNDCVYRYMYQSRYVALHDMDELILPFGVKTWTEMMLKLERMYGTTFGFEFENNKFPFTSEANRRYDVREWQSVRGTNILKYIQRVPNNPNVYSNFKVIVNPRLVLMATVHGLLDTVNVGRHTVRVNRNVARMYHSKNFTYPLNTNLIPDDHLWDYADELIPAVTKVLQDCGFITGKYELLESESEAKPSSKRISALKIFYIIGLVSAFTFIAFIYFQDYTQNANWQIYEPKPSDAPPTNRTFLEEASTACGVIINEGPLIKVGDLNTYVTGSYMDHRFREVKSIAIVNRQQLVTYSCVLCCNGKNVTTLARYAIHSDHFGFEYGTATIACPLNDECLKPTHVALTSSSANHSESITSFQSIMNRDVPAAFPHQFTVCISVMYDYTNVLNLVEAMEMFRLLGATRVAIYLTNCDSNVQKVLDYYADRGFVEVIPWTIKKHVQVSSGWRKDVSGGELHYYGQIPALNDCVYRYMYQSRYVALHDMDELILPFGVKTWTEMLPNLEKMYGTTFGFEFENNQFPFTSKADRRYDVNDWESVRGTNILKYIQRVPNNPNAFNNFKVIVNPRLVLMATVHGLLDTVNVGRHTVRVNRNVARMYHSKNFTYPLNTNLIPDDHLWDYADELIPAVTKVLQDCGFITG